MLLSPNQIAMLFIDSVMRNNVNKLNALLTSNQWDSSAAYSTAFFPASLGHFLWWLILYIKIFDANQHVLFTLFITYSYNIAFDLDPCFGWIVVVF